MVVKVETRRPRVQRRRSDGGRWGGAPQDHARWWAVTLCCSVWGLSLAAGAQPVAEVASSAGSLADVVISGARSERALQDVPARVDLLASDDLDPARVQDIRDLVRDTPNVSVKRAPQRFGGVTGSVGRDGNAGFNIRGLEGNRVLITVDGVRMPREMSSGVLGPVAFGRDYFDLGLISRVEVLSGAASALYGSDGLAGLVALYTTDPAELLKTGQVLGGRVMAGYDSEDRQRRLGATVAGRSGADWQWLVSAFASRARALDNQGSLATLDSSRTAPNPQRDGQTALLGKAVYTPGGGHKHSLTLERVDKSSEVEAYSGRARTLGRTAATTWDVTDLDGRTDTTRTRLSWDGRFRLDRPWADELRTLVAVQQADSQELSLEQRNSLAGVALPLRSRDVSYHERLAQLVLQAEKTQALSPDWTQKLVYGLDVSSTRMDNLVTGLEPPSYERYPLKRFPPTTERQAALFVQSELAHDRWSLVPALRLDHVRLDAAADALYPLQPASLSEQAVSPKFGVIYRAADTVSVYGNLASGFKAPSPVQLNSFFENLTGFYKTIPNPDLKPETSRTLELGVRGTWGPWSWDAAAFQGRYKDFIEELVQVGGSGRSGDPLIYQAVNRASVRLRGLELKAVWRLDAATALRLAYGRTQGQDTSTRQPVNSVNPARWVVGLDHQRGPWGLGASVTHVAAKSPSDIFNTVSGGSQFATPAYTTLDLKAVWQIRPGTRLSATLRNVTDRTYWEWTNVRGLAANSAVLDAYTAPGRSLSVALVSEF